MKPSELFIGVIDLFGVLLPGAIVSFLAMHFSAAHRIPTLESIGLATLAGNAAWFAFFVSSYILGHLVFSAGSYLDHLPWVRVRARALVVSLDPLSATRVDTFKNAIAFLQLQHPEALLEVRRLQADAQFFRSLVIVLSLVLFRLTMFGQTKVHAAATPVCFALILLSFLRYREQREKAIAFAVRLRLAALDAKRR